MSSRISASFLLLALTSAGKTRDLLLQTFCALRQALLFTRKATACVITRPAAFGAS